MVDASHWTSPATGAVITEKAHIIYKTTSNEMSTRATQGPNGGPPTFGRSGKYSDVSAYFFITVIS